MQERINEIFHIWKSLRETGEYGGITISHEVRESWVRSEQYGVDPYKPYCDVILTEDELKARRANNSLLLEQASFVMEHLHEFMEERGFCFSLSDNNGYILLRTGDREAIEFMNVSNFIEGANWSEKVMGTNSGVLSAVTGKPIQLDSYKHYCLLSTFGIGSSSPIYDDDDNIIGMLNLSGPYHQDHRNMMGVVVAAARVIERRMALQYAIQQSEMGDFSQSKVIESISDGIITLDRKGRIMQINSLAKHYLGIRSTNVLGTKFEDLTFPNNQHFLASISENKQHDGSVVIRYNHDTVRLVVKTISLTDKDGKVFGTVVILQRAQKSKRLTERTLANPSPITFDDIVGQSPELRSSVKLAKIAAQSDSNVLLLGETGVGKDMFAHAIHNASNRRQEPFVAINCAGLPRELIFSELFGYEEGAFTGARKGGNPGKFELADQGTLFLDEISEMPLDLQGYLLRALEDGTIMRLGGREIISVNVRIIAASNKGLQQEVKKNNFRSDLYYRLKVIDIMIPSLRDRKGDIPRLAEHFVKTIGAKLGKKVTGIDEDAMALLFDYDWPGNVRELINVIERAVNLINGNILTIEELPPEMRKVNEENLSPWKLRRDNMEEQLIRNSLKKHKGNRNLAAEDLGMSRATIYRKIKQYSIK